MEKANSEIIMQEISDYLKKERDQHTRRMARSEYFRGCCVGMIVTLGFALMAALTYFCERD